MLANKKSSAGFVPKETVTKSLVVYFMRIRGIERFFEHPQSEAERQDVLEEEKNKKNIFLILEQYTYFLSIYHYRKTLSSRQVNEKRFGEKKNLTASGHTNLTNKIYNAL